MLVQCVGNKKEAALELRNKGKSYGEISSLLNISKSTLSYWLSRVEVSSKHKLALLQKQQEGRIKGAQKRKDQRIAKEKLIFSKAEKEIQGLSRKDLWLMGTVAYWCEGSKQKDNNISGRVIFANSDPFLIKLFIKWIKDICKVTEDRFIFNIYVHETRDLEPCLKYWSRILRIDKKYFAKTVLKRHKISTNRKYDNNLYFGLLRITIRNSTDLNRQIRGWVEGINRFYS